MRYDGIKYDQTDMLKVIERMKSLTLSLPYSLWNDEKIAPMLGDIVSEGNTIVFGEPKIRKE